MNLLSIIILIIIANIIIFNFYNQFNYIFIQSFLINL